MYRVGGKQVYSFVFFSMEKDKITNKNNIRINSAFCVLTTKTYFCPTLFIQAYIGEIMSNMTEVLTNFMESRITSDFYLL